MLVIATCQEHSAAYCADEIKTACPGASLVKWLRPGTGLFTVKTAETGSGGGFGEFAVAVAARKPVFTRHICPADAAFSASGAKFDGARAADGLNALARCVAEGIARPFSVQVRMIGPAGDGAPEIFRDKYGLEQLFLSEIRAGQAAVDVSNPAQVISVTVCGDTVFAGVSDAWLNLSPWPGGMRRFAREDALISRTEFKLLEAIEVFGLDLAPAARAADFGAAPGGWSRVMAERGIRVTAIDPAELSPKLVGQPLIAHYKGLAQDFISRYLDNNKNFQLLTDDMRMDIGASARLMAEAGALLDENGLLIMTFKLPPKKRLAAVKRGLEILGGVYEITHVRQLFHNRFEVTVAGRLKSFIR